MQPGVMHLSTQTIKLYRNLLSFSEPLKKAHRILTCGTAENKERMKRKDILCINLKRNGCFVSFINFITNTIKQQLNCLYELAKGNSKRTQETGFAQYSWSF